MKVCFIATTGSVHTRRWVNYLARNGHAVHLISSRSSSGYDERVRFHSLLRLFPGIWSISRYPSAALWPVQLRRLLQWIKPDILHAHYITMNGHLAAASGFRPLVLTAWGSDILIEPQQSRVVRGLTRFALRRADLITCDGDHLVQRLTELGASATRIRIVYFGVDTETFKPKPRDRDLVAKLGFANSPIVISLRSLKPLYDVESLVKAIPIVLRDIPDTKFIIAGEGEQRTYLENAASSFRGAVRFVGSLPELVLPSFLASADVYVSTSLSDAGLSASTAEAMACGLPVIVTDFGDNRKWVEDGTNGFVVPLRNPRVLAARIVSLLQSEPQRRRFGQINLQIAREKLSMGKEMGKMQHLYQELVDRYRSAE